jgi:hypothetical protein
MANQRANIGRSLLFYRSTRHKSPLMRPWLHFNLTEQMLIDYNSQSSQSIHIRVDFVVCLTNCFRTVGLDCANSHHIFSASFWVCQHQFALWISTPFARPTAKYSVRSTNGARKRHDLLPDYSLDFRLPFFRSLSDTLSVAKAPTTRKQSADCMFPDRRRTRTKTTADHGRTHIWPPRNQG